METKSRLGFIDSFLLVCRRKDGSIKWVIDTRFDPIALKGKSITNTGMAQVAGLVLTDVGGTAFDYVGIGDSNAAESAAHTDLQAATNKKRKTATGTQVTTTQTNDTAQLVATFSKAADGLSGTWSVQEAGVFTAVTGGVMLFRKIFTAKSVNWDDGDTLELTGKCQMKQGA